MAAAQAPVSLEFVPYKIATFLYVRVLLTLTQHLLLLVPFLFIWKFTFYTFLLKIFNLQNNLVNQQHFKAKTLALEETIFVQEYLKTKVNCTEN